MMQNWTETITTKMKMTKKVHKIINKDNINAYVYVEKLS